MMNHKQRIKLEMTTLEAVIALTEGNIGAVNVCMQLLKNGSAVDPQSVFGGLVDLMDLDALGIYGSRIWMLYKDVCGQNLGKMIAVLRGWQLGLVNEQKLLDAIGTDETRGKNNAIDVEDIVAKVVKELNGNFHPELAS